MLAPSKAMPFGEPPVGMVLTVFAPYHRSKASWLTFGSVGSGHAPGNDPLSGDCAASEEAQKIVGSRTPNARRSLIKDPPQARDSSLVNGPHITLGLRLQRTFG